MDAFELLLRASDPDLNLDADSREINALVKRVPFDYRDHMKNSMLDPIDSIMMLADQACQKSPIRKPGGRDGAYSPLPEEQLRLLKPADEEFGDDSKGLGTLLQYGTYFNSGSPFSGSSHRRSRAMSEPWLQHERSWSEDITFNPSLAIARNISNPNGGPLVPSGANGSIFPPFNFTEIRENSFPKLGLYNAEHRLGYSNLDTSLPHMLEQYAAIYNKNGRVGIYTREERSAIIHRFREKRKRRVWKKKIRYFCRKNLADRRVRVKGRFVKSAVKAVASSASSSSGDSPIVGKVVASSSATQRQGRSTRASGRSKESPEGSEVSDLTAGASQTSVRKASAALGGGGARQALATLDSEEEGEVDEEDEEEDYDEDDDDEGRSESPARGRNSNSSKNRKASSEADNYSMEVIVGNEGGNRSGGASNIIAPGQQPVGTEKPQRRLKLVFNATDSSSGAGSGDKLVFRSNKRDSTTNASSSSSSAMDTDDAQNLSGVSLLASIAAKNGSEDDDNDDEGEDLFSADAAMLQMPPAGKRIRRHSIAY